MPRLGFLEHDDFCKHVIKACLSSLHNFSAARATMPLKEARRADEVAVSRCTGGMVYAGELRALQPKSHQQMNSGSWARDEGVGCQQRHACTRALSLLARNMPNKRCLTPAHA